MITLLSKLFIRNKDARSTYGTLCAAVGVVLNILLCLGKYTMGALSGSVAIMADAVNNLSDAGSSLITLAGFRIAGKKPDRDHPFGHGRAEYLAGVGVSLLIIAVGLSLGWDSVDKILSPTPVEAGPVTLIILTSAILVKGYMFLYNYRIGKRIDSGAMVAAAMDSIGDCVSTSAVLACTLISMQGGPTLDGWCGLCVSALIIYAGVKSARETLTPLLGGIPDPEFVAKVERTVLSHETVLGIHDLVVHDYGPGRVMISLHAEVDGDEDIFALHDRIDHIERELSEELCAECVIHMDPIVTNDETVTAMRERVAALMCGIGEGVSIHDFRMVSGPTHTNIIYDIVVPHDITLTDRQIRDKVEELVSENLPDTFPVIKIDRPYV